MSTAYMMASLALAIAQPPVSVSEPVPALFATTYPVQWEKEDDDAKIWTCYDHATCSGHMRVIKISNDDGAVYYKHKHIPVIDQNSPGDTQNRAGLGYDFPETYKAVGELNKKLVCIDYPYAENGGSGFTGGSLLIFLENPPVIYRFYNFTTENNNCHALRYDGKGTFLFPTLYNTETAVKLIWHVCTVKDCDHYIDSRRVYGNDEKRRLYTEPGNPPSPSDEKPPKDATFD